MRGHSSRSKRVRRPAPVLWLCSAYVDCSSIYNRLSILCFRSCLAGEHDSYGLWQSAAGKKSCQNSELAACKTLASRETTWSRLSIFRFATGPKRSMGRGAGSGRDRITISSHVARFQKARAAVAIETHRGSLHRCANKLAQPEPSARPLGLPCKPPPLQAAAATPPRHAAPITGRERKPKGRCRARKASCR